MSSGSTVRITVPPRASWVLTSQHDPPTLTRLTIYIAGNRIVLLVVEDRDVVGFDGADHCASPCVVGTDITARPTDPDPADDLYRWQPDRLVGRRRSRCRRVRRCGSLCLPVRRGY